MEESFDKPSFLIYKHDFNSISYFSDELLGLLFRTICEYQNDKKAHMDVDPRIEQAFRFMKTRFDYDDEKYMKRVNANRLNAKKNSKNKENGLEPDQIDPNGFQWDSLQSLEPVETDIGIVIEIDIDLEIDY